MGAWDDPAVQHAVAATIAAGQPERPQCLDRSGGTPCDGVIEYRHPLSPTGVSYPRCDQHWAERVDQQAEIDRRYPQQQPADFDPTYAGESWDEEPW